MTIFNNLLFCLHDFFFITYLFFPVDVLRQYIWDLYHHCGISVTSYHRLSARVIGCNLFAGLLRVYRLVILVIVISCLIWFVLQDQTDDYRCVEGSARRISDGDLGNTVHRRTGISTVRGEVKTCAFYLPYSNMWQFILYQFIPSTKTGDPHLLNFTRHRPVWT